MPKTSLSVSFLTAQYIHVFNMHCNTESLYRNISRYGFGRQYSALVMILNIQTDRSEI